jgi:hypothetical protein
LNNEGIIESICINPNNLDLIIAGTGQGLQGGSTIWESTNGGDSWQPLVQGIPSNVITCNSTIFNSSQQFDLYEGGIGVYNLSCQNCTWEEMNNGLSNSSVEVLVLGKDYTLYAGLANPELTGGGIYKRMIKH